MNQPEYDLSFLDATAQEAAPRLLGCLLQRRVNGRSITVKIVETEAYDKTDAASHSYNGITQRTNIMFGPAGHLYVYFTYGLHYCCNVVVGKSTEGAAVLIRAVEPLEGIEEIEERRKGRTGLELTNGPAKLCQALGINQELNGHDLRHEPLILIPKSLAKNEVIKQTTRVGISKAKDTPWRFYIAGNPFVSKL